MKAVIVEIRGDRAAALLEDGRFVSIPDSAYVVGQEITLLQRESVHKKRSRSFYRRIAAIAASAVLVCTAGGGGIVYATPYGTVSIDVNPSIEYTINRFDRVLSVTGVNEDGQAVLDAIDKRQLLHKKIDQALTATVSQLEAEGYLNDEENAVVLSSETGNDEHSAALAASLEQQLPSETEVYSAVVTRAEVAFAHEKGMTAGRMRLIDEIGRKAPDTFREADWVDRPVKDLIFASEHGMQADVGLSPIQNHELQPEQEKEVPAHESKNDRQFGSSSADDSPEAGMGSFPAQGNLNADNRQGDASVGDRPDAGMNSFPDQPHEKKEAESGFRREENFTDGHRQPGGQNGMQPPAAFGPGK